MSKSIKRILYALTIILVIATGAAFYLYRIIFAPNVILEREKIIYIPTGSDIDEVVDILDTASVLRNPASFQTVAGWMKYEGTSINPGKYTISPGLSNRQLVSLLRSGNQTPVNLVINNVRNTAELAGKIAGQVEIDSISLLRHFLDTTIIKKFGLNSNNFLTLFIPNTYEVYWTIKPESLIDRLEKERSKFWESDQRLQKVNKLNLTREEVYILASIVEKETQAAVERPTVAGLYLNRLRRGIPLQADPTVVFATGIFDLRRVLNKHLEIESPYNTYRYSGLPPGPIYMPSIQSIDAVLNAEQHNYLYMCARPDNSGLHAFAATLTDHNQNANRYRKWLNERGIK